MRLSLGEEVLEFVFAFAGELLFSLGPLAAVVRVTFSSPEFCSIESA